MTTYPSLLPLTALAAALLAAPRLVVAQGGGLSAVVAGADHALLGDPLVGAAAEVRIPLAGGRASARLGAEHVSGDSRRTGSPCAGLVQPGTCEPEPLRDEARLTTVSGGLGLRLLGWRSLFVEATGDLRLGHVEADTRGLTSGGRLTASKTMWGGELGLEGAWSPSRRLPLALEVGVSTGGLTPLASEMVADGYTPFESSFGVRRLRVGLAWRPR
jgi:hypothetical protein